MAIRYQLVNDGENIKNKLYFIVLAFFTVSYDGHLFGFMAGMSIWGISRTIRSGFRAMVERRYQSASSTSMPTNAANCGPKKIVWDYVNATQILAGYIQYCQIRNEPTPSPIVSPQVYSHHY